MKIVIDEGKCNGCEKCWQICPKGPRIFKIEAHGGRKVAIVLDVGYCINCGNCVAFCPTNAIKIEWKK